MLTLPLVNRPNNVCGECKECCTVLPISEGEWIKPAGQPCEHLCEQGCSLYGQERWPKLCRTYFCYWRDVRWLGEQANCRPDRLGVIFQDHGNLVAAYETRPGAAYDDMACRVMRKMQQKYKGRDKLRINVYTYQGILWLNEEVTRLQGVKSQEYNWVYHREPYEHFILEAASGPTFIARTVLDFFAANPWRDTCRFSVDDDFGEPRIIRRESVQELEAIAAGKQPEGELEWIATVTLAGLAGFSGGTRVRPMT